MNEQKPKSTIEIIKEAGYVMVVRCRDCKYAEVLNWLDDAIVCKKHSFTGVRPDEFFCADGERA